MISIWSAIVGAVILLLFLQSRKKDPEKILGVYSQPGKWYVLKYIAFVLLLTLRRLKTYIYGKEAVHDATRLEKLKVLSGHPLAFDAVFFQAVSQDGFYLCTGLERRHLGISSGLIYIVLPEYGILSNVEIPSTKLATDPASLLDQKYFGAQGITFTPVTPMKTWHISYKGKMRQEASPEELLDVEFDAEWKSDYPWFLFEADMPVTNLARAMSRERWSRKFFNNLKEAHQSHYEQMGHLTGQLKINGKVYPLNNIDSFRDHSFGHKRDWSLMHRYIYHVIYLEDHIRLSIGVVSQPCTSSVIEMGYVCHPDGTLDPITDIDLKLYQHAENGQMPDDLYFEVTAARRTYEIKVQYHHDSVHYKGNEEEAKMCERFFTCEVNGVPGRGISEWHYNIKSRLQ